MKTLLAPTEDFIKVAESKLDADATAGSNVTVKLIDNNGMANTDFVVVGWAGNELAELEQINQAVTAGTDVRVATLKFNHKKGEPVVKYRYDKRKFYGTDVVGGSYTEITSDGSPKPIQVDAPQGTTLEYTGTSFLFFKSTYFNSQTNEETDIGDAAEVSGDESSRYAALYAIRKHAGLAGNAMYSDVRLETKRKQAENEINSAIYSRYVLPLAEVPPLLSQICELLAAGYIDFEEFGADGEGVKWLGEARAILKNITDGTRRLLGANMVELQRNAKTGVLNGYPNASDVNAEQFNMDDKF